MKLEYSHKSISIELSTQRVIKISTISLRITITIHINYKIERSETSNNYYWRVESIGFLSTRSVPLGDRSTFDCSRRGKRKNHPLGPTYFSAAKNPRVIARQSIYKPLINRRRRKYSAERDTRISKNDYWLQWSAFIVQSNDSYERTFIQRWIDLENNPPARSNRVYTRLNLDRIKISW